MKTNFAQLCAGAALAAAAAAAGFIGAGAAFAANIAPHVDLTQPHVQEYPDSAQSSGEEGAVLVNVFVRPNGKPTKIKVAQSSGFADLDDAAVESVLNWRFVPAMRNGRPTSDWAAVKIVYQLPRIPSANP